MDCKIIHKVNKISHKLLLLKLFTQSNVLQINHLDIEESRILLLYYCNSSQIVNILLKHLIAVVSTLLLPKTTK
jgi:hypothetical protein